MVRKIKAVAPWVLGIAAFCVLYAHWANYQTGYDHGAADTLRDQNSAEYSRGRADGADSERRRLNMEQAATIQAQARAQGQEYEQKINAQLQQIRQQAYNQGAAEEARKILDRGVRQQSYGANSPNISGVRGGTLVIPK